MSKEQRYYHSSVSNYTSLGNYYGFKKSPNTLSNIMNPYVQYPVNQNYQIIPKFAGTAGYTKPNYNNLIKGSCHNYSGINQAYTDCSNPSSSQGCSLNDGQCVTYSARSCDGSMEPTENVVEGFGFDKLFGDYLKFVHDLGKAKY
jgi:hypothetical protein